MPGWSQSFYKLAACAIVLFRLHDRSLICTRCCKIPTATSQAWTPTQLFLLTGASVYRSVGSSKPSRRFGILYAPLRLSVSSRGSLDSLSRGVRRVAPRFTWQVYDFCTTQRDSSVSRPCGTGVLPQRLQQQRFRRVRNDAHSQDRRFDQRDCVWHPYRRGG